MRHRPPREATGAVARPSRSCELIAVMGAGASLLCLDAALAQVAAQTWDATVAPVAREDAKAVRLPQYMRRKWSPTVMTTVGGEVADRVALGAAPTAAERAEIGRFAAPQLMGAEPAPASPAGWSSIVTGTLGPEAAPPPALAPATDPALREAQAEPAPPAAEPSAEPEPADQQHADPAPQGGAPRPQPAPEPKAPSPQSPPAAPESTTAAQLAPAPAAAPPAPADQPPAQQAAPAQLPAKPFEALPPDARPAQQYCYNIAEPAADARAAFQAKKIKEMDETLDKRVVELDAKIAELKTWLARRDEFSKRAQEKLVGFYTRMRPDASALQLAAMDEETAAAVLTKLEPKVASAVMNEMAPERAARLASIISGASKVPSPKAPRAAAAPVPAKPSGEGNAASPQARPRT